MNKGWAAFILIILTALLFSCNTKKDNSLTGHWKFYEMTSQESPYGMEAELVYYHIENTMKPVADSMGRPLTAADTLKARLFIQPALEAQVKDAWIEFSGDGHFIWQIDAKSFTKGHYEIKKDSSLIIFSTEEESPKDKTTTLPYTEKYQYAFRNDSLKLEAIDYNGSFFLKKSNQK